jgi:hypothetical protein
MRHGIVKTKAANKKSKKTSETQKSKARRPIHIQNFTKTKNKGIKQWGIGTPTKPYTTLMKTVLIYKKVKVSESKGMFKAWLRRSSYKQDKYPSSDTGILGRPKRRRPRRQRLPVC